MKEQNKIIKHREHIQQGCEERSLHEAKLGLWGLWILRQVLNRGGIQQLQRRRVLGKEGGVGRKIKSIAPSCG